MSADELADPATIAALKSYDDAIAASMTGQAPVELDPQVRQLDIADTPDNYVAAEPEALMPEADDFMPEAGDTYLGAKVRFPTEYGDRLGKITQRKRDMNGNPIGKRNNNPLLDTREYVVEFPDGAIAEYTTSVIAEHLYSQVDSEGRQYLLLDEIEEHRRDASAVASDDGFYDDERRKPRITTKGWHLSCLLYTSPSPRDLSTSRMPSSA